MLPLRILHVAPYSEHAWAYGGIPRVLASLTRAQARAGCHVTVATTDVRDAATRLTPSPGCRAGWLRAWCERSADAVEHRVFPNLSNTVAYRWQFYQPAGLGAFLRAHARDFDVAHLHACHNLVTATAGRVLRRAGVPYVVQPNGTARRIERRRVAKWVFDALAGRGLLPHASAVVAVSEAERRQLEACGVPSDRLHVVPNPLAPAPTGQLPARGAFRRHHGLTDDALVLFLGMLTPRKHPAVAAEAVAGMGRGRVQLVFVGNDMGAGAATRRAVSRLGLSDRARFTGVLSGYERFVALADADVVVYASQDEVFGLVALEALQVGTPVVVGDDSGCGETVAALGGGVLVPPGDAGAPRPAFLARGRRSNGLSGTARGRPRRSRS
jgi:glycosyltransferase involved in cell wall biosynthesis